MIGFERRRRAIGAVLLCFMFGLASSACHGQPPRSAPPAPPPAPTPGKSVPAPTSGAAAPNTADGRPIMQIGLTGFSYYEISDPFLDASKVSDARLFAFYDNREATPAEVLASGVMDSETLLPKAMGPFARYNISVFAFGARYYPAAYAGDWVIDWVGETNPEIIWFDARITRRTTNRIELKVAPANSSMCGVSITQIGAPLQQFRIYRKSDEARLAAGEIFNQRFLDYVRRYKVVRTMDWQQTNVNPIRTASQLKSATAARLANPPPDWAGQPIKAYGVPLNYLTRLARQTDTALWMTAPNFLGAPPAADDIFRTASDWQKRALDYRALGKTHARSIIASPEWDRYADEVVRALKDEQYPEDRMLYLELGNEVWNTAAGFLESTNYYWGMGDGLFPGTDSGFRDGYGYASARLAEAFDAALARAGRKQAHTIVIAGQNAGVWTTERALTRYKAYFTEKGRDASPWLARAGVSTASYFYNAITPGGAFQAPPGQDYATAFLAEIKRDRSGLMKRIVDWTITGGPGGKGDGSLPFIVDLRRQHNAIADKFGARFIGDYEGENHETGLPQLASNPDYVKFMKELRFGAEGERLTRAWAEALRTQNPNAMISNFVGVSEANSPRAGLLMPWQDCYYGEKCGRDRALEPFLRPAAQ